MKELKKNILSFLGFIFIILVFGLVMGYFKSGSNINVNVNELNYYKLGKDRVIPTENKKTVMYFWATWCGVCTSSLGITKYNEKIAKFMNIPFVSVAEADKLEDIDTYIAEKSIEFPVILPDEKLYKDTNLNAYPTFIFLDKNGKIVFNDQGIMSPMGFFIRLLVL